MIPITHKTKDRLIWSFAILFTTIISLYATVFSLTHGIYEVYPFLYFMPVILFVYFSPRWGVTFTLMLATAFLVLSYLYGNMDPDIIAISTAWFVIFVTIGVVTSSFAEGLRKEERKYRGIFENSQAAIFTFDFTTRGIKELNEKCARMLRYEREELTGKNLALVLPKSADQKKFFSALSDPDPAGDLELFFLTRDGILRQFLVSASVAPGNEVICSAIDITERRLAERVIQKAKEDLDVRVKERTDELQRINEELKAEIQERKRFEAAIQLANKKLNTLSSITRHDILNQITAIVMYLSLAEEIVTDPALAEHLQKIEQITQLIQKQIRFTRDYQNIGATAPQWQNIAVTIRDAVRDIDLEGVSVEHNLKDLEVFADYLLERVFYNLVENSLRHGEKVTRITFSAQETPAGLVITCEDDGVGVPANVKEKIFRREYYRNTGYGLFLAQEILSITGLSIREIGEPGSGARFEIVVPRGEYRFTGSGP